MVSEFPVHAGDLAGAITPDKSAPGNFGLRPVMAAPQTPSHTTLVHNGVMATPNRVVRQSVSLPAKVAAQVRSLAKARKLSANRMLVELIENGMEAEKRKQQEFFDLAERFRAATDPDEVKRLGDQMGRMVFGN